MGCALNIGKMISLTQEDYKYIEQRHINLSHFVRWNLEIARETGEDDNRVTVAKLRIVISRLQDLLAAYQMDASTKKEDVRC